MKIGKHKTHPAADVFPLLLGDDAEKLTEDIAANGLLEPIWLDADDLILDGRNRYLACLRSKVEPTFRTFDGDDCIAFVVSQNLRRRHLTTEQRAEIAVSLAGMPQGGDRRSDGFKVQNCTLKLADAAKLMGVSRTTVANAAQRKRIAEQAAPELAKAVDDGKVAAAAAARALSLPPDEQRAIAAGEKAPPPAKTQSLVDERWHVLSATDSLRSAIGRSVARWPPHTRVLISEDPRDIADDFASGDGHC